MESFQASGEDIERALMDLGPLLGVSIKEETPDDIPDASAAVNNASGTPEASVDAASSPEGSATSAAAAKCAVCSVALAQAEGTPKLMECLHSICEPCLKTKIDERMNSSRDFLGAERISITCPSCRLQCQPSSMIDQRFVMEKMVQDNQTSPADGLVGEQQCNSCEDTDPATSYCVECAEFICDNCVRAHQRLKITKDHTIKSKEEAVLELQAAQSGARDSNDMFCNDHTQERLSLFCETCDRLTCRDCQLQHHRDHKYQFSTEMAAQARAHISSLVSEVSYKRVLLGSAMKVIRDRQTLIADKKKALVREITQTVVKLTNAINTRGKQLVLRLNEVCDSKQRTLSEKKKALEQLAAITDHCVQFVNSALEQGSDTAVLHSKRAVCAHLQRIKSRRADIPNPEIPVRITLALDKLPELIKVLSSIGGIVVDGKVDGGGGGGGGGGAQGPYHPPPAPQTAPQPPHSAVVALQHVAMQQSYGQGSAQATAGLGSGSGSGAGAGVGGASRGRPPLSALSSLAPLALTPLRHPHVTSTTHPHHLHGMNELNLRGLLNQAGMTSRGMLRSASSPVASAHHSMHHYHHLMGAYSNAYQQQQQQQQHHQQQQQQHQQQAGSGRRSGTPRTPSPAPPHAHHLASSASAAAKWHIPQLQHHQGVSMESCGMSATSGAGHEYKITLRHPPPPAAPAPPTPAALAALAAPAAPAPPAVTSTNPKTPSPSLSGGLELDAVCAESVQDLMATIAKLDSNGVQVLPESTAPSAPAHAAASLAALPAAAAPLPHSSTDDAHLGARSGPGGTTATTAVGAGAGAGATDPNEDWCAVCMDGGELMCCDKCPKVFHQYCHIPTIDKLPNETESWQCLLCVNFAELPPPAPHGGSGLSPREQKIIERVTLELYCQYETSLPFREPVPRDNTDYYNKISSPMCLDMIRSRLQPAAAARYSHVTHFLSDCRLLFRNAYCYNPPDSQYYKEAKRLEEFFDAQLLKWLPQYAYWHDPATDRSDLDGPLSKRSRIE